jgi:integrase/recombinase XerD
MKVNRHGQAAIFENSEWAKLRRSISDPKYLLLLSIAYYTGERWGAILQLRWSDIQDGEITFRAVTRKGKQKTRQVPIHKTLKEFIAAYPGEKTGLVFPSPRKPNQPISFQAVSKFLQARLEEAGLIGFSTHSTRRTFITKLYRAGCDLKTLQALTGHQSIQVLSRYIETDPERLQNVLCLL